MIAHFNRVLEWKDVVFLVNELGLEVSIRYRREGAIYRMPTAEFNQRYRIVYAEDIEKERDRLMAEYRARAERLPEIYK